MSDLVAAARRAAATIEHPWDRRALEWPLTAESVVIDVGGYIGRWALQIAERYAPRLYVFEPQTWAYEVCREVLGDKAQVHNVALGVEDGLRACGAWGTDGCSLMKQGSAFVLMREVRQLFRGLQLSGIDLMLMNVEGYEYTLLPYMLDRGIRPDRLMVQFHTFVDPDEKKTADIYEWLAATGYRIAWTYGLVLTAWERQGVPAPRRRGRKKKA